MIAVFIDGPLDGTTKDFAHDYPTVEVWKSKTLDFSDLDFPAVEVTKYYRIAETTTPGQFIFSVKMPGIHRLNGTEIAAHIGPGWQVFTEKDV